MLYKDNDTRPMVPHEEHQHHQYEPSHHIMSTSQVRLPSIYSSVEVPPRRSPSPPQYHQPRINYPYGASSEHHRRYVRQEHSPPPPPSYQYSLPPPYGSHYYEEQQQPVYSGRQGNSPLPLPQLISRQSGSSSNVPSGLVRKTHHYHPYYSSSALQEYHTHSNYHLDNSPPPPQPTTGSIPPPLYYPSDTTGYHPRHIPSRTYESMRTSPPRLSPPRFEPNYYGEHHETSFPQLPPPPYHYESRTRDRPPPLPIPYAFSAKESTFRPPSYDSEDERVRAEHSHAGLSSSIEAPKLENIIHPNHSQEENPNNNH